MAKTLTSFEQLNEQLQSDDFDMGKGFVQEKDQKYGIVSKMAFLLGISKIHFGEGLNFDEKIFSRLQLNKNARIIRNLCMIRTSLEKYYWFLYTGMKSDGRSVLSMKEYIDQIAVAELSKDGVKFSQKPNTQPIEYIKEMNGLIADRINNCKEIFPSWLNWEYVKETFIMPDGRRDAGVKEAGELYKVNKNLYPYQAYINWEMPHDYGNILLTDWKFVTHLYSLNCDEFTDFNKVIDVSAQIKGNIYDFITEGEKVVMIVDCENSDVYNIISMLRNLDWEHLQKITKIILVNDVHTNLGWQELEKCTEILIEHIMTSRIKEEKSLVDGTVIAKAFMECYEYNVDSFVLLSSDSDFWTLIDSLRNKAKFLVMVEHLKCSPDYKDILADTGVFFCYLDDFNSGEESEQMKTDILLRTINNELSKNDIDVRNIFEEALVTLRIDFDEAQKEQFYKKYIKNINLGLDESGKLIMECRGK